MIAKDLGISLPDAVYVNEHPTRQNKQLLGTAIAKKKGVNWQHVCTTRGSIGAERGVSRCYTNSEHDRSQ